MARLSAYTWNKRDMLELVRYQKTVMPKAAGAEEVEIIVAQVKEKQYSHPAWGKYVDSMQVELSAELKKWYC